LSDIEVLLVLRGVSSLSCHAQRARPALSRRYRAYVISAPAESLEAEYPDKAVNYAFPVFPYPARKIYRSAGVDPVKPDTRRVEIAA
jgi:hypothetical protein